MNRLSTETNPTADEALRRIVGAYDDPLVRAYCTVRFMILRQRFLFEIGQYLPPSGHVLDVGCGFGLFALYFATRFPRLQIQGFDLSERRIQTAQRAASRLGVQNVRFQVGDAVDWRLNEPISAAYMLDLVHHIPAKSVEPLIATLASHLSPGGRLVIKDIEPALSYKLAFTWLLDKVMDYKAPVRYWAPEEIQPLLEAAGFEVHRHRMIDYLPYPHILYVGTRRSSPGSPW
ncbi:MAG: class I SAM-dependent methyltransferase [Acidobacteriota bacterium]